MNKPYILVFGMSVVDIFGFCGSAYRCSDSIPGKVKISFGGVSRNIAENMARVGANVKFISILGNDEIGRSIISHSKEIGYDMDNSMIVDGKSTPTYMAVLNESGDMVSAVADMRLIDGMTTEFIDTKSSLFEGAEYTFVDADDPKNLEYMLNKFSGKTKFILDPISTTKAVGVKHLVKHFHTIKPNRHEAEIMSGIKINTDEDLKKSGEYFLNLGVKNVFISLDQDGIYYTNGQESGKLKVSNVEVKNVTGAGDSFVAGLGYSYYNNFTVEETIKYAMAMAIITISHGETINPEMCHEKVIEKVNSLSWEMTKF